MRPITRFATIAVAAVTAIGGVACETGSGGNGSPGEEEAPADDTGEDGGLY
ncbi:MAG: hypothetical protein KY461_06055 [Actinobacteria bacterium]|nr:hypothetical protein [Actinomycetota bacterium]